MWRLLSQQMQPKTRARPIALLQAFLAHLPFKKGGCLGTSPRPRAVGGGVCPGVKGRTESRHEIISSTSTCSQSMRSLPTCLIVRESEREREREKVIAYEETTASWSTSTVYRELDNRRDTKMRQSPWTSTASKARTKERSRESRKMLEKMSRARASSRMVENPKARTKASPRNKYGNSQLR